MHFVMVTSFPVTSLASDQSYNNHRVHEASLTNREKWIVSIRVQERVHILWDILWDASGPDTLWAIMQPGASLTRPPGQNGRHFADDILRCISMNDFLVFWLKFHWSLFLRVQLANNPALVLIMAWRRIGDKPLLKPMMVRLPTHIGVTQWVNKHRD